MFSSALTQLSRTVNPEDVPPARLAPARPAGAPRVLRVTPAWTGAPRSPEQPGAPRRRLPRVLDNRGYLQVAQEIEGRGLGQAAQALTPGRARAGRTRPAAGDWEALARRRPHVGLGGGGGLRGAWTETGACSGRGETRDTKEGFKITRS